MDLFNFKYSLIVLVCVSLTSSSFSDGSSVSNERRFLQAKKSCPVNFEFQNYTIITSKCTGPNYPSKLCCSAFKDFSCQFADYVNDLTTDCASTMFSYINLKGKYPPGLFASECREGKPGLKCPEIPPPASQSDRVISRNGLVCDELLIVLMSTATSFGFSLRLM